MIGLTVNCTDGIHTFAWVTAIVQVGRSTMFIMQDGAYEMVETETILSIDFI